MPKNKKKFLLIDGHAIIHRAFHALPPLTTKAGEPVNAVYGFLLILMRALKDLKPDYIAVAFDSKGETFRHKKYPAYKAQRETPPPELTRQFPVVREFTAAFGFPVYAQTGFEADDLIGTVCAKLDQREDVETVIVTGDLDLLQLVDANTKVLKIRKGIKDTLLFDKEEVVRQYGISPKQIVDFKGLRGDPSDNITGVKGIGPKTAVELLQKYHNVEEILKNTSKIGGRVQKTLEEHRADAVLSKELATIDRSAPVDFSLDKAQIARYHHDEILNLFQKYEFKSLLSQLNNLPGFKRQEALFTSSSTTTPNKHATEFETKNLSNSAKRFKYHLIQTAEAKRDLYQHLSKQKIFAFDTETSGLDPFNSELVGISFSWKAGEAYYCPCGRQVPAEIKKIFQNEQIKKTGHNVKFDIEVLNNVGIEVAGVVFDTMLASYLLNAGSRGHSLDNLAFVEFGHQMQPITELIGKGKQQISLSDVEVEKVSWYSCEDADFSWRLYQLLSKRVNVEGFEKLLTAMEIPLVYVLAEMEQNGVHIDENLLKKMSVKLHNRLKILEKKIHQTAGAEFNIASNVQLKEILFTKMHLPTRTLAKTKTGFSTAASELEKLKGVHPIIELISEHRELSKLTSTYIDALPKLVNPNTGRIHTSFNQTITATGRLSSSDPNLQNIPIRTELGREIRQAFIPEHGHRILSCDYSQIELRIVAHLADDKVMKAAFANGEDIHTRTAAELNDVELSEVTFGMRRQAKAINFGILYGMGVGGIMRDSGATREEAQAFLDKYFSIHTGIAAYLEDVKEQARKSGYSETMFGRRRYLPEIRSTNRMIAAGAERAAVNMPTQGAAADIMKMAMIVVQKEIEKGNIKAKMILQVHDELVFEVETAEVISVAKKIVHIMENVYQLSVPLVVNAEVGTNWGKLKRCQVPFLVMVPDTFSRQQAPQQFKGRAL